MARATIPNANHHLWRNGRLWWVAFTVVYDGWRQERVRRSLGTADVDEARGRRDDLLQQYATLPNADVVAFRLRGDATTPFRLRPTFGLDGGQPVGSSALRLGGESSRV